MEAFKILETGKQKVLIRYEGYDDENDTHDVIIESFRKSEEGYAETCNERAQFSDEDLAIDYVESFTQMSAVKFIVRHDWDK